MRLRYTAEAKAELRAIIQYGVENALPDPVAHVGELRARLARLATIKHPGRQGRVAGTREWVVTGTPYIAVFRREGDQVTIVRVLHGARQWPPREDDEV